MTGFFIAEFCHRKRGKFSSKEFPVHPLGEQQAKVIAFFREGEMSTWRKLLLAAEDCGERGLGRRLLDEFNSYLEEDGGKHPGAALLTRLTQHGHAVWFYYSPDACSIIPESFLLVTDASPCSRPDYPSTADNGVRLVAGDARALEIFWPEKVEVI